MEDSTNDSTELCEPLTNHDKKNEDQLTPTELVGKVKFFKKRTKLVKYFACVIIIVLLLVCVIFVTLYFNALVEKRTEQEYCNDPECVQIAARIIKTMDRTADPCSNFYDYACGSWIRNTPIPDSRSRYSRFEKLSERNSMVLKQIIQRLLSQKTWNGTSSVLLKAATYYESCVDVKEIQTVGAAPLQNKIKELGSWPVTDPSFDARSWNMMNTMVKLHREVARSPLFNIFVTGDIKKSDVNIIVFDQGGLGMDDRDSYLKNGTFHVKKRTAYIKLMKAMVTELGASPEGLNLMDEVFDFEKKLAKFTASVEERRSFRSIYDTMTLQELANRTKIDLAWLKEFVDQTVLLGKGEISGEERIVCYATSYIRKAFNAFQELRREVQVSYLMWHGVKLMAPIVQGPFQELMDDYLKTVHQIKSRAPRWETCISDTMRSFGVGLSRPFVDQVYDKAAKEMSTEMIQAIKGVFANNILTMDWMDEETRQYAMKKASHIVDNIGYPEKIFNDTALEEDLEDLQVTKGQYFLNFMAKIKHHNTMNYKHYGKPVDKTEWGVLPTAVNAYYAPTENKIGFPAGILQWPFYDRRSPRAISYGAIGMVVGHEVSHAFDDQGKDFNIEGNFKKWWTDHSEQAFKRKSQCFIDQYSNFSLFGKFMNGRQTLGENLADNGGLRQSLQAYRLWVEENGPEKKLPGLNLSPEQLYFLAFGQVWCTRYRESAAIMQIQNGVHSLSMFRVIGTLQNSEEFSKAYNCPLGSHMNPKKKCRVW